MGNTGRTTLGLALRWTEHRYKTGVICKRTMVGQTSVLVQFCELASTRPERVSRRDVDRWLVASMRLAATTRRTQYATVRTFCRWLTEEGIVRRDPCAGVPKPKVPRAVHRAFDADDAAAVLAACQDATERLVIVLGLQLALRRGEIARLEVGDVSLASATVRVVGKGDHERVLPLTAQALAAFRAYTAERAITAGPLVRSPRFPTRGISPDWVWLVVRRVLERAGVKHHAYDGVSTHALRHTAATDTHRASGDVVVVQQMLGHVLLSTTQIYVRGLDVEHLRVAMEGRSYGAAA